VLKVITSPVLDSGSDADQLATLAPLGSTVPVLLHEVAPADAQVAVTMPPTATVVGVIVKAVGKVGAVGGVPPVQAVSLWGRTSISPEGKTVQALLVANGNEVMVLPSARFRINVSDCPALAIIISPAMATAGNTRCRVFTGLFLPQQF
jgi:hypothetical protein